MEGFFICLLIALIVFVICYCASKSEGKNENEQEDKQENLIDENKENEEELLKQKREEEKKELLTNGLPVLTTDSLRLTKNEICHFVGEAFFCKNKQVTVGYEGGSRGVSFRVVKGVSFRVGNYRGHSVKKEITERTSGVIYLTSKKIVFSAEKNSSVIKYDNIITLNVIDDILQIQTEKKTYLFEIVDSYRFLLLLECIINQNEEGESSNNDDIL